jgi:hypothetical protein
LLLVLPERNHKQLGEDGLRPYFPLSNQWKILAVEFDIASAMPKMDKRFDALSVCWYAPRHDPEFLAGRCHTTS